jgi:hypothetical protein
MELDELDVEIELLELDDVETEELELDDEDVEIELLELEELEDEVDVPASSL